MFQLYSIYIVHTRNSFHPFQRKFYMLTLLCYLKKKEKEELKSKTTAERFSNTNNDYQFGESNLLLHGLRNIFQNA